MNSINKYKISVICFAIGIATIVSRFLWIGNIPPHLSNDEITIAYDAYSILKTGKDTSGKFLPFSFKSWGDYKPPLSIYLSIPSIYVFGNNDFAARFPSAVLGCLTVFLIGFLIYILSDNLTLAITGSGIMAITPYHIHFSRMLFEANIALFFIVLGLLLFFLGLKNKKNILTAFSFCIMVLSSYTYHAEKVFIPVMVTGIFLLYKKHLYKNKGFWWGMVLLVLLYIPLVFDYTQNLHTNSRANTEFIINDPFVSQSINRGDIGMLQKIKVVVTLFFTNYSNYLNPGHMFFDGLKIMPKNNPYQIGLMLPIFVLAFLTGIFFVKRYFPKHYMFIYFLFFVSPVVPALTLGSVNNGRNMIFLIPLVFVSASGFLAFWECIKNKKTVLVITVFFTILSFFYFILIYYKHFPIESGINYQYGYKQISQYTNSKYHDFEKIVIDPRFGDFNMYSGMPGWYIPYYTNLDPVKIQTARNLNGGNSFDKYEIRDINWNKEEIKNDTMYVVPVSNRPDNKILKIQTRIDLPNHTPAFEIYSTF